MISKVYGYYPLGFRRALRPGERKPDAAADDAVTAEYLQWQQDRAGYRSWANHQTGIKLAVTLFGDFFEWLRDQQANPNLSRQAWEFIIETVRFINTGERRINVFTHASLILMEVKDFKQLPVSDRKVYPNTLLDASPDTVIARWMRHPQGYADMLCSLAVFFGNTQCSGAVSWGV